MNSHPERKFSENVKAFRINSSVYAASRIRNSPLFFTRILWFLILVACLIGSICKIWDFYYLYQQYPVVVDLHVDHMRTLQFPAVTICNLNRIKNSKTPYSKPIKIVPQSFKPPGTSLVLSERNSLVSCTQDPNGTNSSKRNPFNDLEFLKKHYEMDKNEISKLGHSLSDMLEECSFNGKSCSAIQFTHFVSFRFGNCFTFNQKTQGKEPVQISNVGVGSGLILKLNLEIDRYIRISHTEGAIITIHSPEEIPNPEEDGLIASPKYETLISLRQTVVNRLPDPYKDQCLDYKAKKKEFVNRNECIRTCIQDHNFAKCGCTEPTLKIRKNLKVCNLKNMTEICCLDNALYDLTQHEPVCDCPLPCSSVYYKEKVSRALLNKKYFGKISDMKLNIFYESLERNMYEYRPKYNLSELLSYLGNIFGLWLGLSLVVVFELFEALLSCIKFIRTFEYPV
ncbi:acid-sensing ion channel 5 [Trichonephila clavata]|uniref:Acid-sensing ion channel 5 n=1 Tax=Trichonephila clavata TaxID=2740835 RepID=A0A8X6G944_TRICU|nr:acid-sensing ion channel 5 [Trichonephila clavata]